MESRAGRDRVAVYQQNLRGILIVARMRIKIGYFDDCFVGSTTALLRQRQSILTKGRPNIHWVILPDDERND